MILVPLSGPWRGRRAEAPTSIFLSAKAKKPRPGRMLYQDEKPELLGAGEATQLQAQAGQMRPSTGALSLGPWDPGSGTGEACGTQGLGSQDGGS